MNELLELLNYGVLLEKVFLPPIQHVHFSAAAPDIGGGSAGVFTGSVGYLCAAAMQTAGVFAQAALLKLGKEFLTHLAALCYLCSIIGACLSIGVFGNYSKGLYFLVGPPLFFFMISTTKDVAGANVQVGERIAQGSIQDQTQFMKKYVNDSAYENGAEVSYFFYLFDNMVSSVVQGIVAQLIDTKGKEDVLFKARERVFSWLAMSSPDNAGFNMLIAAGVTGECAEVNNLMQKVVQERKNPENRSIDPSNLTDAGIEAKAIFDEQRKKKRFLLDPQVIDLVIDDPATQQEYRQELVSCDDVWNYTRDVASRYAEDKMKVENFLGSGGVDPTIDWQKVFKDVEEVYAQGGASASQMIAAYLIKNAMNNSTNGALTTNVFNRVPFNAERQSGAFDKAAGVFRFGGYFKIQYFAKAIPYIQGLLLYLLSIAFPFFAVFLVMPGRAGTFIVWCSLWVWVKSWDVGFALVSVARKIMWMFVKASPTQYAAQNLPGSKAIAATPLDWSRPETVIAIIADNDPLATENTYFAIIGILTISVPLLTAHFCLGATNLYDAFKMSIDQTANRFATKYNSGLTRTLLASPAEKFADEAQSNIQTGLAKAGGDAMRGVRAAEERNNTSGALPRGMNNGGGQNNGAVNNGAVNDPNKK